MSISYVFKNRYNSYFQSILKIGTIIDSIMINLRLHDTLNCGF